MDNCAVYKAKALVNGSWESREVTILSESDLEVYINGNLRYRMVCTFSQTRELVVGRLYSDGLIRSLDDILSMDFEEASNTFRIEIPENAPDENRDKDDGKDSHVDVPSYGSTSGRVYGKGENSGIIKTDPGNDHRETKDSFDREDIWKPEWIKTLFEAITDDAGLHRKTYSTHSCFLMKEGEMICHAEDIGRHNCLDKIIGYGILNDIPLSRCIVFISGRLPRDMVSKAVRAGFSVMASKSMPTEQSIAMAKTSGMTLLHYSRFQGLMRF